MNWFYLDQFIIPSSTESKFLINIEDNHKKNHILNHLKKRHGDSLKILLSPNLKAEGTVIIHENESKDLSLEINRQIEFQETPLSESQNIILHAAICRPQTIKKILEHGSAYGINQFNFFQSEISDKTFWNSSLIRDQEQQRSLTTLGIEQTGIRAVRPRVNWMPQKSLRDHFEDNHNHDKSLHLILDPLAKLSFYQALTNHSKSSQNTNSQSPWSINLWIGPERGWSPREYQFLSEQTNRLRLCNLGPAIFRIEHALYSVLSQLHLAIF